MSYQVLALKYRPQTFDEVVGQPHVTTTLVNAISSDRVAHAILFTGPRGTGKTTIARILSKALNCETGPVSTPCNTCKICTDIVQGHCTDVFEIDGASNNSVDQIRDLRENVSYMPAAARYKIYIIDEVHMLSTAAFNALLKTLEEPPKHVLFIFATTEVHKIPATILSRCQRHDLGKIDLPGISNHLKKLGISEGFEIEQQTLDLIAQEADGSIRDSLSLFDRILSASQDNKIDHGKVLEILGVLDFQILQDTADAIISKNGESLIELVDTVDNSGMDLKRFYSDIITYFRDLHILKRCGIKSAAANIPESRRQTMHKFCTDIPAQYIADIVHHLLKEESLLRQSSHTRFVLEMILFRLFDFNPGAYIDTVIEKLDALARKFTGSPASPNASENKAPQSPGKKKLQPIPTGAVAQSQKPYNLEPSNANPDAGMGDTSASAAEARPDWPRFLAWIEQKFPFMFALLSKGNVKEKQDRIHVELTGCSSFDTKRISGKKEALSKACKDFLNKDLDILILSESQSVKKDDGRQKKKIQARQAAFNHPMVVEAQKLFDGKIINY